MAQRREFLKAIGALAAAPVMAHAPRAFAQGRPVHAATLTAAPGRQQIVPPEYPATDIWAFNGTAPGPELRFRQGERVRIAVRNSLPQDTTVHWHGVRLPNAMDGVPHVTQPPIAPGGEFVYEFDLPDAGTFWYHPHEKSHEQVGRGLYGAFVVAERDPPPVDRDVTWVLSDFRLTPQAAHAADWDSMFDMSHDGRVGNTVAVNGKFTARDGAFEVTRGERVRLRLVNAAVARIFALRFRDHAPVVIANDGQPVTPHPPENGLIVLGPGMRADLILDCRGERGKRYEVADEFYPRSRERLLWLAYRDAPAIESESRDAPVALKPNPLAEPDVARATRHEILFEGGAMSPRMMGRGMAGMGAGGHPMLWFINDRAVPDDHRAHEPMLDLKLGGHYVFAMRNDTAWYHPIHLHGLAFRIVARNGQPTRWREWADTALMAPRERVDIAFVADAPGTWMFHCHVLAHQHAGMMTTIRVA